MAPAVRPEIEVFDDREGVSLRAAALFEAMSKEAISARGIFRTAISGGSTPLMLYCLLAAEPYRSGVDWEHVEIFFADERCVPPDRRDSNFGAVNEALLSHVPVTAHRIEGELEPREAAIAYEGELRRVFALDRGVPVFDLIFLGLGMDGHTASLFPRSEALKETGRLAVPVHSREVAQPRVTLTLPVINAARKVAFIVTGGGKAEIVRDVIAGGRIYPASMVAPSSGKVLWLLDRAAAALL